MLFSTKLTSLINALGLIDSASLENHHNKSQNSGSHKWPKTFFMRCIVVLNMIMHVSIQVKGMIKSLMVSGRWEYLCVIAVSSQIRGAFLAHVMQSSDAEVPT